MNDALKLNNMNTQTDYNQQALDFLKTTGTTFKAKYFEHDYYFDGDKDRRDIYKITLKNSNGSYTFKFGQSITNSGAANRVEPTAYDVLSCLTKYDIGGYEDFVSEFGYEFGPSSKRIYNAVVKEFDNVSRLFTDEQIEALQEIQ